MVLTVVVVVAEGVVVVDDGGGGGTTVDACIDIPPAVLGDKADVAVVAPP